MSRALTPKQQRFVEEYLVDLCATQAAVRAGYSVKTAAEIGAENLTKDAIKDAIAAAQAARSERTQITADQVLERWWTIANADPRELIEFRRTCCRSCYGVGGRYQRTQVEMDDDRAAWSGEKAFDEKGGVGYDARKAPNPECPACFGEGVGTARVQDTRTLSDAARLLYAGVRQTKDGIQVKMRDQGAALVNVARHLGMFVEKHEHTGKDGGPIEQLWKIGDNVIRLG